MTMIFEECHLGEITSRNRLLRAATAESLCTLEGCPAKPLVDLYSDLAKGGIGVIITGYSYVSPDGKPSERALSICDGSFAAEYRQLVQAAHGGGAKIVLQLAYGGSKSKLLPDDPRRLAPADAPARDGVPNVTILGPSAIENPATGLVPMEAVPAQLSRLAAAFGQAAKRAKDYGFDGVEVHAAHGYLLSQFFDGRLNKRTDEYGGPVANRARFACECVASIRRAVGEDFPVIVKLNAWDVYDDPDGALGGLSQADSMRAAELLARAGASAIEVSGDWHHACEQVTDGQPYFGDYARSLVRKLDVPVIVTGGWRDPRIIASHLSTDGIAAAGMSRPLICEPYLPMRWEQGDDSASPCAECGICMKQAGIPCPYRPHR